jgi:hypothetical protein
VELHDHLVAAMRGWPMERSDAVLARDDMHSGWTDLQFRCAVRPRLRRHARGCVIWRSWW